MKIYLRVILAVCFFLNSCENKTKELLIQQLRMNIHNEPPTLDPRKGSEWIGSALHFMLFEGLVRLDVDGSIKFAQAESLSLSEDKTVYTFVLRDTLWSDGSKVTAYDFEWSWKKILSPDFPAANAFLLYPIKNAEKAKRGLLPLSEIGIRCNNEKTLVIELERPTPYFLNLIAFCVFFPVNQKVDQTYPQWALEKEPHFVSNGPFLLTEWKHNSEIVLEKNWHYWDMEHITLDRIHISMVSNESTALYMYERGELDVIGMPISPISTDAIAKLRRKEVLNINACPGTTFIAFNLERFPFTNKNIRQAFAYAINRQNIVSHITQLGEDPATGMVPPLLKNGKNRIFFQDYSILKARQLFKEGLKELDISKEEFPSLAYHYPSSESDHKLAQVIESAWTEAFGIHISLHVKENKVFLDELKEKKFDVAQCSLIAQYTDLMNILERFKNKSNAKNYPGWENPEFIRFLEKSAWDPTPEARFATLEQAEELLIEDMPIIPLYYWKTAYMLQSHFHNQGLLPNGAFEYTRLRYRKEE